VYFTVSVAERAGPGDRKVPAVRVRGGGQPVSPDGQTVVQFELAEFGEELFEPPSSIVVRKPGLYIATGEIVWGPDADTGLRGFEIERNDERVGRVAGPNLRAGGVAQQATAMTRFDEGDIVHISAIQGARADVAIADATLALAWIGA
jgi:hypothetical protein